MEKIEMGKQLLGNKLRKLHQGISITPHEN